MKIQITVKPNAKKKSVEKMKDGTYRVCVKSPPTEGKANAAVMDALAEFFRVPKSKVEIVAGLKGKRKWVTVK